MMPVTSTMNREQGRVVKVVMATYFLRVVKPVILVMNEEKG